MSERTLDQSQAEDRLWKAIDDSRIGMLGVAGGEPRHMQPMTAFTERGSDCLWFFTGANHDLVRDIGPGHAGMFCFVSKDRELYACISGDLSIDNDRTRIDGFWNPLVSAWYPGGKDDPNLTLVRLDAIDAQIWISAGGPIRLAWQTLKANVTKKQPDEGSVTSLRFQ